MPFDFAPSDAAFSDVAPGDDRSLKGLVAYHDGLAAETSVENHYAALGCRIVERRWRGRGGDIDLICKGDDGYIFVEVKKARTHAMAAERLSIRQLHRICASAEDYCAGKMPGVPVNMRLDLATVDALGDIEILPNISLM